MECERQNQGTTTTRRTLCNMSLAVWQHLVAGAARESGGNDLVMLHAIWVGRDPLMAPSLFDCWLHHKQTETTIGLATDSVRIRIFFGTSLWRSDYLQPLEHMNKHNEENESLLL
jgi:hypothetical protein